MRSAQLSERQIRVACDSLVALAPATADGRVLFAKNSDRPAAECQPLVQAVRGSHPAGARLRCTYIEIPQATETARVLGSRPFWCWGFEHGLNEHGVAIGNHTVFTKDALSGVGLIGMDLVRLGLERGRSAEQAIAVITTLVEQYGQGGSGYHDKDWAYHNSFLVADPSNAFVLETSDRHWAVRRVHEIGSVSNHLTIGDDWDTLADGTIEHAIGAGWWSEASDARFDFAAAYRDTGMPEVVSSGRHQRTCTLLERHKGQATVASLRSALRDHYGSRTPRRDLTPADARYFTVCMHAEPVGTTTASLIARLAPPDEEPLLYWASLGSPCLGMFLPLFLDGEVPAILSRGGEYDSDDSAWWLCKRLLTQVERDWERRALRVRDVVDRLEADLAAHMDATRITTQPAAARAAFTQTVVDEYLARVRQLTAELQGA